MSAVYVIGIIVYVIIRLLLSPIYSNTARNFIKR